MLNVQAILQHGSVTREFMTDDTSEAEELRHQMLAVEGLAKVSIKTE